MLDGERTPHCKCIHPHKPHRVGGTGAGSRTTHYEPRDCSPRHDGAGRLRAFGDRIAARADWLLDPTIDVHKRVCRYFVEQLDSAFWAERLASDMGFTRPVD
jgi:hypothetical protein